MSWCYVALFAVLYLWTATTAVRFVRKQTNPEWVKGAMEAEKITLAQLRVIFIIGVIPGLNILGIIFYIPVLCVVAIHEIVICSAVAVLVTYKALFRKETKE